MSQKKRRSQRQTHLNDHPAEEWALPLDARWRPGYDIGQVPMASLCAGLSFAWPLRSPDRVLRPGDFDGIIRLDFIHLSSHVSFTRLTKRRLNTEGMAMEPGIDLSTNPQAKMQVALGGPKRAPTQG